MEQKKKKKWKGTLGSFLGVLVILCFVYVAQILIPKKEPIKKKENIPTQILDSLIGDGIQEETPTEQSVVTYSIPDFIRSLPHH
jgi:hypothetical protein